MSLFQWENIDHSLVSLKLTDLAEKTHSEIRLEEERIRFENRHNLNDNAVPSLILRMKQERADEWARKAYEIYCGVWQTQGHLKSGAFVRAVCSRGIVPMLRAQSWIDCRRVLEVRETYQFSSQNPRRPPGRTWTPDAKTSSPLGETVRG